MNRIQENPSRLDFIDSFFFLIFNVKLVVNEISRRLHVDVVEKYLNNLFALINKFFRKQ